MDDCIFCRIIKNELPCYKIYEDDSYLAFLDIQPVLDGHVLIIPKKHVVWMQDVDDETIAGIFKLSKKLMLAMKNGLGCDYVQLGISGTDIPHFHIHLIPRNFNDGLPKFSTKEFNKEGVQEIIEKITQEL